MDTEMRKRLEEAAEKYRGYFLGRMNKCRELKGEKPLSADNVLMDICLDAAELGYKEGAELGYKEAIEQATRWLKNNTFTNKLFGIRPIQYWDFATKEQMLSDFETYMNKLWEEKK